MEPPTVRCKLVIYDFILLLNLNVSLLQTVFVLVAPIEVTVLIPLFKTAAVSSIIVAFPPSGSLSGRLEVDAGE